MNGEADLERTLAGPAHFLIVDDHPLFLEALQRAIASVFPEAATVEATSIEAAKKANEQIKAANAAGRIRVNTGFDSWDETIKHKLNNP
ncbi:MAG: hypothetical protein ABL893_20340, partial [Hyphomicrobium sp.]